MLSEDFDKKIKLAAEQHHPAYDEKAWLKMEKMLSRYLPLQKRDRRRAFFFLLLSLLIIGGGIFVIMSKPWTNRSHFTEQLPQGNKNKPQTKNIEKADSNNINFTHTEVSKKNTREAANEDLSAQPQIKNTFTGKTINHPFPNDQKNVQQPVLKNQLTSNKRKSINVNENNNQKTESVNTPTSIPSDLATFSEKNNENKLNSNSPKKDEINQNTNTRITNEETKKTTRKNKLSNNKNARLADGQGFSFSVSAGPDISKAGNSKTGRTTLLYGAGIGYTRNRLTLRTGVYMSKKIYWANYNDYKLSRSLPPAIEFVGADANCKVLVIPVKLSYNFGLRDRSNWFAGGGLSSYLMKREKYTYVYKTASGPSYYNYSAKNENKHYFSILNLSAGYSYKINNFLSITAEPYAEIPLTGIGAGKVHLNSGGVLFTVGIHPFKK